MSEGEGPFDNIAEGVFNLFGGTEGSVSGVLKHPVFALVIGVVLGVVLMLLLYFIFGGSSGMSNSRNVGSGSGRYNQLQRLQQMEFATSTQDYIASEVEKAQAAGMTYSGSHDIPMDNVYSGFQDRKAELDVEHYQVTPMYPEGGFQNVFNDNVWKNIAYGQ